MTPSRLPVRRVWSTGGTSTIAVTHSASLLSESYTVISTGPPPRGSATPTSDVIRHGWGLWWKMLRYVGGWQRHGRVGLFHLLHR